MDRKLLLEAYSEMPLDERRNLAKHMNNSMKQLYQYCMRPSSDHIGKERMEKFLSFRPLSYWENLASINRQNKQKAKPIELILNFINMKNPDVIIINGKRYIPE